MLRIILKNTDGLCIKGFNTDIKGIHKGWKNKHELISTQDFQPLFLETAEAPYGHW